MQTSGLGQNGTKREYRAVSASTPRKYCKAIAAWSCNRKLLIFREFQWIKLEQTWDKFTKILPLYA